VGKSPLDREIHFEIHALLDDRWSIYSSAGNRDRALDQANALLATRQYDAVKVTREGFKPGQEDVIFEESGQGRVQKKITITPVETAPLCKKSADYYGFESRKTIGRLLRKYLDENSITALELLHCAGHLKWLIRNETLLNQAVQNIARVQSKESGEKPHVRIDELHKMAGRISKRADKAADVEKYYLVLKEHGLEAVYNAVNDGAPAKNHEFLIRAAIAARVGDANDWERKLDHAITLAEAPSGNSAFAYMDEVIAEILDGAAAVTEVLGYQKNLGESLQTLVRLSGGSYTAQKRAGACLERLNAVRARRDMPYTRSVMLNRVEREVGGINPLTREGQGTEEEAFRGLMADMVQNRAIADGGGGLSEAATLRAKTVFHDGVSDQSSDKAIEDTLGLLPTKAAKFGYLIDLCGTDFGTKNQGYIVNRLAELLKTMKSATDLVHRGAKISDVIVAAADIRDRLLSTGLPDEWRLRFARHIYNLLAEYQGAAGETGGKTSKQVSEKAKPESPQMNEPTKPDQDGDLSRKLFAAGDYIFHEGDDGDEAYLIKSGQVEISRRSGDREIAIAKADKGSIIGEMALVDSKPRMASAKALKKTELVAIPKKDLEMRLARLGKTDPVMRRLVGQFVERMRKHPIIEQ